MATAPDVRVAPTYFRTPQTAFGYIECERPSYGRGSTASNLKWVNLSKSAETKDTGSSNDLARLFPDDSERPQTAAELDLVAMARVFEATEDWAIEERENRQIESLELFLRVHRTEGLMAITRALESGTVFSNLSAAHLLQAFGLANTDINFIWRLWTLRMALRLPHVDLRDSAVVGLMNMNHPFGANLIKAAAAREADADLRNAMVEALQQWA